MTPGDVPFWRWLDLLGGSSYEAECCQAWQELSRLGFLESAFPAAAQAVDELGLQKAWERLLAPSLGRVLGYLFKTEQGLRDLKACPLRAQRTLQGLIASALAARAAQRL